MKDWKFLNLIKISIEDPLKEWKLCKKYFVHPKIRIGFANRNWHDGPIYKLIEIYSRSMSYKDKYGMLEHENDPYVEVTLLGLITFHIAILAPSDGVTSEDICYWEGMLRYMQLRNQSIQEEDALYASYQDNIWNSTDNSHDPYTIKPFLNNLGWHTLHSMIQKHDKDSVASVL